MKTNYNIDLSCPDGTTISEFKFINRDDCDEDEKQQWVKDCQNNKECKLRSKDMKCDYVDFDMKYNCIKGDNVITENALSLSNNHDSISKQFSVSRIVDGDVNNSGQQISKTITNSSPKINDIEYSNIKEENEEDETLNIPNDETSENESEDKSEDKNKNKKNKKSKKKKTTKTKYEIDIPDIILYGLIIAGVVYLSDTLLNNNDSEQ